MAGLALECAGLVVSLYDPPPFPAKAVPSPPILVLRPDLGALCRGLLRQFNAGRVAARPEVIRIERVEPA